MMRTYRTYSLVALMAGTVIAASDALSAPQPSPVPKSWELELEYHDPARIAVVLPGETEPTIFWYMIYTVTNNSNREVNFYPQIDLVTDTLRVVHAGDHVSPTVFDAIKKRHEKLHPFMVAPLKASGKLLRGEDNARTSVAIFRTIDPDATSFTVYLAGLSGEIVRVPNPALDPDKPESEDNPQFFTLRKTLAIKYDIPGDLKTRKAAEPIRKACDWVMR